MRRPADALLIGAWRVWSRLSFALAVVVVLVALPFVGPVLALLWWLGWLDE
jgi:hypothetical protein